MMLAVTATYTYELNISREEWDRLSNTQQLSHVENMTPDIYMIDSEEIPD